MNVKITWDNHKNDPSFLRYFPDSCLKKCPPREYFWRVFSVIRNEEYQRLFISSKTRLTIGRELVVTQIEIPEETGRLLQSFNSQMSLQTICNIKSWKETESL